MCRLKFEFFFQQQMDLHVTCCEVIKIYLY